MLHFGIDADLAAERFGINVASVQRAVSQLIFYPESAQIETRAGRSSCERFAGNAAIDRNGPQQRFAASAAIMERASQQNITGWLHFRRHCSEIWRMNADIVVAFDHRIVVVGESGTQ